MKLTKADYWASLYGPGLIGLLLILAAAAHRMQLGTASYTTSWLILPEFGLLILLLLICAVQPLLAIYYIIRKRWQHLLLVGATLLLCFILIAIALALDSSTLVYAT